MILLFCNILPQIQRYSFVTTAIIESLKRTIFDKKGSKNKYPSLCSNNNGETIFLFYSVLLQAWEKFKYILLLAKSSFDKT